MRATIAYQHGRKARDAGRPIDTCPHNPKSANYTAWTAGWKHRNLEYKAHGPVGHRAVRAFR
jgi:ribosome modulation factor